MQPSSSRFQGVRLVGRVGGRRGGLVGRVGVERGVRKMAKRKKIPLSFSVAVFRVEGQLTERINVLQLWV